MIRTGFDRTIQKAINNGLVYVGISAGSMYAAGNLDDGLNIINNPIIPHWNGTKIIELPDFGEAIKIVDGQAVYVEDDCISLIQPNSFTNYDLQEQKIKCT